ncbi:MAG: hypothetical protein E7052_08740 [Lentisphaerae bacterium]|nr:hypothetical protein [Lentisphaerota bacterium]
MKTMKLLLAALSAGVLSGCCCKVESVPAPAEVAPVVISKISTPIKFDGKLDETVWKNAPAYSLHHNSEVSNWPEKSRNRVLGDKFENGKVKFLYDDKYLYVGACLEDGDIMSFAEKDQTMLYQNCDTLEIFLWPQDGYHYWELYSTASGFKASLFYPSGGMATIPGVPAGDGKEMPGLEVVSQINGSLNMHSDHDKGWTTEVRIPLKELAAKGIAFAPGKRWSVMIGRYNYSIRFNKRQVSCAPAQPAHNFHLRDYYAPVVFK